MLSQLNCGGFFRAVQRAACARGTRSLHNAHDALTTPQRSCANLYAMQRAASVRLHARCTSQVSHSRDLAHTVLLARMHDAHARAHTGTSSLLIGEVS
jgi:hypothetical protein